MQANSYWSSQLSATWVLKRTYTDLTGSGPSLGARFLTSLLSKRGKVEPGRGGAWSVGEREESGERPFPPTVCLSAARGREREGGGRRRGAPLHYGKTNYFTAVNLIVK